MSEQRTHNGIPYIAALVALLALTGLSFGLSYVDTGSFAALIALSIAAIKATIVALIFMHLLEASFVTRMVVMINVLWVALICLGIAADVGFR